MRKYGIKAYMFYVAFAASLGGLLFGFDTAVISGAEKSVQQVYGLSDFAHGFTIATALIGTIIGAFFSTRPVERYGRLKSLQAIALVYLLSALGSALILNWYAFIFFRFAGGLAVGASSVAGPLYIAEISPSRWRGRFVAFFQFNVVSGILLAFTSNLLINGMENDWRWMLGVMAAPALLFFVLLLTISESPRWLMSRQRGDEARGVLQRVSATDVENELEEIRQSLSATSSSNEPLFQHKYWKPILIAFLVATFNQFSGINAIMYYAPRIFEMSGLFRESSLFQSVIIGTTNLVFTLVGMSLIDKMGRKQLLYIGTVGMTAALGAVFYGFYSGMTAGYYLLVCLMVFIAFFAVSTGACIWVIISEVFPNSVRNKGQVLGSMVHWIWSAVVTWTFPVFIGFGNAGTTAVFGIFTLMTALSFIFAWKLPETKNKSLEQIQRELLSV